MTTNNESSKDFEQKLKEAFLDECSGVEGYTELAHEAESLYPNTGYAYILKGIAKEEGIHKNHLKSILQDMGVEIDCSMKTAEEEANKEV